MVEQQRQWTPDELQALAALGLSITPHSDPARGWGYTWQGRDWNGPYPTIGQAIQAAFERAINAQQQLSLVPFAPQVGDLARWTGEEWETVTGPFADKEEREAFTALTTLLAALSDLRSTETTNLLVPGPAQRWRKSLDAGEQALGELEEMVKSWREDFGNEYHRGVNANEDLDDDYEESEEGEEE